MDILRRASRIVDRLLVAVLVNAAKKPLFTPEERVAFLREVTRDMVNVEVHMYSGLLAAYVMEKNANVLIRGVRSVADYEYESQMAHLNRTLTNGTDTWLIPSNPLYSHISGSAVREIALFTYGGGYDDTALSEMVPSIVKKSLQARYMKG